VEGLLRIRCYENASGLEEKERTAERTADGKGEARRRKKKDVDVWADSGWWAEDEDEVRPAFVPFWLQTSLSLIYCI
jgi:hypothetical protein